MIFLASDGFVIGAMVFLLLIVWMALQATKGEG